MYDALARHNDAFAMTGADSLYHRLFSNPRMVEHLVRAFLPDVLAAGLDPARMERINAKFHGGRGDRREGDVVWRLSARDGSDLYLYLLIEFQKQPDRWMAVRAQVYEGLLWQHVIAEGRLRAGDRLPPVLMVVLYNGEPRWTAPTALAELIALPPDSPLRPWQPQVRYHLLDMGAFPKRTLAPDNLATLLFRLEHPHGDPLELAALVDDVIAWFRTHPDFDILKALFTEMVRQAVATLGAPVALPGDMQEMRTMLETQGERWIRKWKAEGKAEGRCDFLLHLLQRRFGALPAEMEARIRAADDAALEAWGERLLDARTLDDVFGADAAH